MTCFIITKEEIGLVALALEGMQVFWAPGGAASKRGMTGGKMPKVDGAMLFLSDSAEVNSDLRHRVGIQWRDQVEKGTGSAKQRAEAQAASHLLEARLIGSGVPDWEEVSRRYV